MSGLGTITTVNGVEVRDPQPNPFQMGIVGSVYEAAKGVAANGESQSLLIDSLGRVYVVDESLDVALSTRASEATLATLAAKDFATQTTLASVLTKATSIDGKDFATQTTLAAMSAKLPATLGQKTAANSLGVILASDQALPLPTGAATETTQSAQNTLIGAVTETAPASDTASSGLNGRLQRIAQRLTSMIALLPASLGQKAMAASLAVSIASDQSSIGVKPDINVNGTQTTGTASSATTLTAPANAVGFILQAANTNAAALRYRVGGVAAAAAGNQLEPGRDTGYIPCGANVSICPESGTLEYQIQWVQR